MDKDFDANYFSELVGTQLWIFRLSGGSITQMTKVRKLKCGCYQSVDRATNRRIIGGCIGNGCEK